MGWPPVTALPPLPVTMMRMTARLPSTLMLRLTTMMKSESPAADRRQTPERSSFRRLLPHLLCKWMGVFLFLPGRYTIFENPLIVSTETLPLPFRCQFSTRLLSWVTTKLMTISLQMTM
jgi:hypothetical protein